VRRRQIDKRNKLFCLWWTRLRATLPTLKFSSGVHVKYAESVLPIRDGVPEFKDFPAEFGRSREQIAKYCVQPLPDESRVSGAEKTGRLLILKSVAVSVVKSGSEIAAVAKPGSVSGELSALLDPGA
jgi:hypothetical protein